MRCCLDGSCRKPRHRRSVDEPLPTGYHRSARLAIASSEVTAEGAFTASLQGVSKIAPLSSNRQVTSSPIRNPAASMIALGSRKPPVELPHFVSFAISASSVKKCSQCIHCKIAEALLRLSGQQNIEVGGELSFSRSHRGQRGRNKNTQP